MSSHPELERQEWDAWLREAEEEYERACEHLRMCGSYDFAIIHTVPAAKARVKTTKARLQERLTAYIAFVEAHK